MQSQSQLIGSPLPLGPSPPPPVLAPAAVRRRRPVVRGRVLLVPVAALAALAGLLLGSRASAEAGRSAAAAALAAGDPARSISLDEAVGGRGGWLMLFDPGAAGAAQHAAQLARLSWARQLAREGRVDAAVAVLSLVREPALHAEAAEVRAQLLVGAAAAAGRAGHAELALLRLEQAARDNPPASMLVAIAAMRAADEVGAATELVAAGRAPDALALLDNAATHGAAGAAAAAYPAALLAGGQSEISNLDFRAAAASLQQLVTAYGSSNQAATARSLLGAPQTVSGTLVGATGRGLAGRVRLSTHFTQLPGGYVTSGPFFYGTSDAGGDFSIGAVPVGGPYVLEYLRRDGGWTTLVDPRTDLPAHPVTVSPLVPEDLTFIVMPA